MLFKVAQSSTGLRHAISSERMLWVLSLNPIGVGTCRDPHPSQELLHRVTNDHSSTDPIRSATCPANMFKIQGLVFVSPKPVSGLAREGSAPPDAWFLWSLRTPSCPRLTSRTTEHCFAFWQAWALWICSKTSGQKLGICCHHEGWMTEKEKEKEVTKKKDLADTGIISFFSLKKLDKLKKKVLRIF